jgi:ABC-type lipoprotein export system ATPase subunit
MTGSFAVILIVITHDEEVASQADQIVALSPLAIPGVSRTLRPAQSSHRQQCIR